MRRLPRRCLRCGRIFTRQGSLCSLCGTTKKRGYGHDWQQVRLTVLQRDHYQCQIRRQGCIGVATTVDHIQPLSRGGKRLDPANLQAACLVCNSGKGNRP
jgi:5-methylcytosine-specific restriction protein A